MTKIKYDDDPFSDRPLKWMANGETQLETIAISNDIITEFRDEGFTLILRQLYYQILGKGLFTESSMRTYKNLGTLITKARNNGLLSWYGIEDRGRGIKGLYIHEENDHEVVSGLETLLSFDFWQRQDTYVEVWVEKESLSQVIRKACDPLKTPFMATRGYLSSSEAWRAGQRFKQQRENGKECVMIHLGDHDPEGLDMTRDNEKRLIKYSDGCPITVDRIALNMDQIEKYNPPPNYAKASSSRFDWYVDKFGDECWELDALKPQVIVDLITEAINPYIDRDLWDETEEEETAKREHLEMLSTHWVDVKSFMDELQQYD